MRCRTRELLYPVLGIFLRVGRERNDDRLRQRPRHPISGQGGRSRGRVRGDLQGGNSRGGQGVKKGGRAAYHCGKVVGLPDFLSIFRKTIDKQ